MKHLLKPRITEKAYATIERTKDTGATYTFVVKPQLTKQSVASLIEKEFNVTVESVRMVTLPGKARRFRGIPGRTSETKKAVVRLKKGDTIAAFDAPDAAVADDKE